MNLKDKIRSIPNWPIEGVIFRDITTVLEDPDAFRHANDLFYERYKDQKIDKVVGIDARGFIFGAVLAYKLNLPFIPVRKKGKLPYKTISAEYDLEYGKDTVEMNEDAIQSGDQVLIVDDLIATGGTIAAAIELVQQLGGIVAECCFLVELPDLGGRKKIPNVPIFCLIEFEGE
jgi:adenine phosphoribosyltransferase